MHRVAVVERATSDVGHLNLLLQRLMLICPRSIPFHFHLFKEQDSMGLHHSALEANLTGSGIGMPFLRVHVDSEHDGVSGVGKSTGNLKCYCLYNCGQIL